MATSSAFELTVLGTFETGVFDESAQEIPAFDPASQRLFVSNGDSNGVDIIDLSDPSTPTLIASTVAADLVGDIPGAGTVNSVAVANGVVAIAISNVDGVQNGFVAFLDTDGALTGVAEVGVDPDAVTFTPDGDKLVVANEGERTDDADPEGSISIIDISSGVGAPVVTTLGFGGFDTAALTAAGVSVFPGATFAESAEPESIAISPDGTTAFVTLQENNAFAIVDLIENVIVEISPLGLKDHSIPGAGLDASNDDGAINIETYANLFGAYRPDGVASFEADGATYYVTANEGDAFIGTDVFDDEEDRVRDLLLDPTAFPNADVLQTDEVLGRLEVSRFLGDTDGDGDFDQLVALGGRSFAIWNESGDLVFDSGDAFEQITAALLPTEFNANNDENGSFDNRSDDAGPEPEGVAIGEVDGRILAFIGLERIGGVMVYDVTDPTAPTFVQYVNNRNFSGDAEAGTAGDLGPEGLTFISAEDSPNGAPLLVVANEVSGSTTVYSIEAPTSVVINEFLPNPPGSDPELTTVELFGAPGADFSGFLFSVESDDDSQVIDRASAVTGTFDANGLLAVDVPDLENPSFTLILTDAAATAGVGDVVDLADVSNLGEVLDAIGVPDAPGDEANVIGAALGGTDFAFIGDEPRLIFRDGATGDLYAVDDNGAPDDVFDVDGNLLDAAAFDQDPTVATFGDVNPILGDAPQLVLINEFQPNPDGSDPDFTTVELLGVPGETFSGTIYSIESDNAPSLNRIDEAEGISGTFDVDGLLVVEIPDIENPSFTLVLSDETAVGVVGDVVDPSNPSEFLGVVLDAIGVPDQVEDEDRIIGEELGGVDFVFTGAEPELIFRDSVTGVLYAVNDNIAPPSANAISQTGDVVPLTAFDVAPTPDTFGAVNPTTETPEPQAVLINEVRPNPPGSDPATQTVELLGTPGESFSGFLFSIEADFDAPQTIDRQSAVSGTFDADGLLTVEISDLENPSFTLVLTDATATAMAGDSVDVGDAASLAKLGAVLDAIGVPDELADEARVIGAALGGTDLAFIGSEPELIFRDGATLQLYAVDADGDVFDAFGNTLSAASFDQDPAAPTFAAVNPIREAPSFDLQITEIWPGNEPGANLTADWFEIANTGDAAWNASVDGPLFFDDESADPGAADELMGVSSIAPGETVVFVDDDTISEFLEVWSDSIDLDGVQIGTFAGAGLAQSGDAVTLFLQPLSGGGLVELDFEAYPDGDAFGGRSYQVGAAAFSDPEDPTIATTTTVNDEGQPAIGNPGDGAPIAPDEPTPIAEIQGAGHVSPLVGQSVVTFGIVTAVDTNRFFIMDPDGDGDEATSEGLEIFTSSAPTVAVGDAVFVSGVVSEFLPGGAATGNLSITQIAFPTDVTIESSENPLPAAVVIGSADGARTPPNDIVISEDEAPTVGAINLQNAADDAANLFDPEQDGIDFYESLEGMLVTVDDPVAISATNRFGESWVLANDGADATGRGGGLNDRGGLDINADADGYGDLNPERIQLQNDFGITPTDLFLSTTVGDNLSDVTGVVSYGFGSFEIAITEGGATDAASSLIAETTGLITPDDLTSEGADDLTIGTYNVLNLTSNFDSGDDDDEDEAQLELLASQIVANLGTPDIIGLQEIQDDSGVNFGVNDGVLSAETTLQALVDEIAEAGGPTYDFFSATVEAFGATGGVPGGNIRNAFLWNSDRVTLEDAVTLDPTELAALGVSNPNTFDGTRDPLLGTFAFGDEEVTVVNNHFSSRFGSDPVFGGPQLFEQGGEASREAEALANNEIVDQLLAGDPSANIVVLGDFNTFEFTDELSEDLVGVGEEQVLTNLIDIAEGDEAYSFNFRGNSQSLDHIFVTDGLLEGAELDFVHVNVDFPTFASDHEPLIARFDFGDALNVVAGTPGNDFLIGTEGDDLFETNGGRYDRIEAGAGMDQFDFSAIREDGGRNIVRVYDYEEGETILGVSADDVVQTRTRGDALFISLAGDRDTIILDGEDGAPAFLSVIFEDTPIG